MDGTCRRDDSNVATSMNHGVASSSSESNTKVDNPYLVTFLIKTPTSKWYVVWCSSKNGQQKDMCLEEIGLHAQNMNLILGLIVHIILTNQ
jgi:hypothetical protein